MSTATDTAVTTSVVVDVPQARAFTVFTDEMAPGGIRITICSQRAPSSPGWSSSRTSAAT